MSRLVFVFCAVAWCITMELIIHYLRGKSNIPSRACFVLGVAQSIVSALFAFIALLI